MQSPLQLMADGLSPIQMWGKREEDISLFKCSRTSRKGGSRRENSLMLQKHKKWRPGGEHQELCTVTLIGATGKGTERRKYWRYLPFHDLFKKRSNVIPRKHSSASIKQTQSNNEKVWLKSVVEQGQTKRRVSLLPSDEKSRLAKTLAVL